jgi:GntR family transcriptional regulator / MocR family aminotransferase
MIGPLDGQGPLYRQLYRAVREAIVSGRMPSGKPSGIDADRRARPRDFAQCRRGGLRSADRRGVHRDAAGGGGVRVRHAVPDEALRALPEEAGIGRSDGAPGRVPALGVEPSPCGGDRGVDGFAGRSRGAAARIEFRYGSPNFGEFPHTVWARIVQDRQRRATVRHYDYGPPEGEGELREALADYLTRSRGLNCSAEQIVIVGGSQQAVDLVCAGVDRSGRRGGDRGAALSGRAVEPAGGGGAADSRWRSMMGGCGSSNCRARGAGRRARGWRW